jgi:hypothetical protein
MRLEPILIAMALLNLGVLLAGGLFQLVTTLLGG